MDLFLLAVIGYVVYRKYLPFLLLELTLDSLYYE